MANLIQNLQLQTVAKGQYKTDKYAYNVSYSYSDGKVTDFGVQIMDLDGGYLGQASIGDDTSSVTVRDQSTLQEHTGVVAQLYAEAEANVAAK